MGKKQKNQFLKKKDWKKIIGVQKFMEKLESLTFTFCVTKVQAQLISGWKSWYVIIKSEYDSCYPIDFD